MLLDNREYNFDRVFRIGVGIVVAAGLVWLLGYLSDVLIPFAAAFLLAYLLNPLVVRLQARLGGRRNPAVALTLILAAVVTALVLAVVVPMIAGELNHMGKVITQVVNSSEIAERAAQHLPADLWKFVRDFFARDDVQEFFKSGSVISMAETAARKILPGLWGFIAGAAGFLMGLVGLAFVGLYLVFLLLDFQKVRTGWQNLLPRDYRDSIVEFVLEFDAGMSRYFRGQALVAALVGVLCAVGFALIGLPLGVLLGLFVGVLNMVPYLQLIAVPPALVLAVVHALETGGSIWMMLGLTVLVFVVVQAVQDGFLTPRIMGEVTGLSPAMILLSLSVWGKLLGLLGLIIALPVTCLLLAYYRRMLAREAKAVAPPPEGVSPPSD